MIKESFLTVYGQNAAPHLATALGDMVLAWTKAEDAQVHALAAILRININDALRAYQKLPNFRSRTQMLILLIELNPSYESISTVVLKLSQLSKTRNRYVHGSFIKSIQNKDKFKSIDYNQPTDSKHRSKLVKPNDIRNHSDAVRLRATELHSLLEEIASYQDWLNM